MLKIKESVNLNELEKYGFDFDGKDWFYKIDESETLEIPTKRESEFYRQLRLLITDEYYNCWTGDNSFDILYDLIKDGLVERVDD